MIEPIVAKPQFLVGTTLAARTEKRLSKWHTPQDSRIPLKPPKTPPQECKIQLFVGSKLSTTRTKRSPAYPTKLEAFLHMQQIVRKQNRTKRTGNLPASREKGANKRYRQRRTPNRSWLEEQGLGFLALTSATARRGARSTQGEPGSSSPALSPPCRLPRTRMDYSVKSESSCPGNALGQRTYRTAVIGLILWRGAIGRLGGTMRGPALCTWRCKGQGNTRKIIGIVGKCELFFVF
jgi:hypothetical protein